MRYMKLRLLLAVAIVFTPLLMFSLADETDVPDKAMRDMAESIIKKPLGVENFGTLVPRLGEESDVYEYRKREFERNKRERRSGFYSFGYSIKEEDGHDPRISELNRLLDAGGDPMVMYNVLKPKNKDYFYFSPEEKKSGKELAFYQVMTFLRRYEFKRLTEDMVHGYGRDSVTEAVLEKTPLPLVLGEMIAQLTVQDDQELFDILFGNSWFFKDSEVSKTIKARGWSKALNEEFARLNSADKKVVAGIVTHFTNILFGTITDQTQYSLEENRESLNKPEPWYEVKQVCDAMRAISSKIPVLSQIMYSIVESWNGLVGTHIRPGWLVNPDVHKYRARHWLKVCSQESWLKRSMPVTPTMEAWAEQRNSGEQRDGKARDEQGGSEEETSSYHVNCTGGSCSIQ